MFELSKITNTVSRSWADILAGKSAGLRKLALVSFLESTVVPIPIEALVAPLMVANFRQAFRVAVAVWFGCILGALAFYLLAWFLFEPLIGPALKTLGLAESYGEIQARLGETNMFWTVFVISVTPVPLQLATLGAGSAGANPFVFLAAIALSRGVRYFGLAILAQIVGPKIENLISENTGFVPAAIGSLILVYAIYHIFS